jgi:hypothetical protein
MNKTTYRKFARARFVDIDEETERRLKILQSCSGPLGAEEVLIRLTDDHGLNLMRPKERQPRYLPQPYRDPTTNQPAPNPYVTGNKADIRALETHNPPLAEHYKRLATAPNKYLIELAQEEFERVENNARERRYSLEHHAKNPFVGDNRTEQAAFQQREGEATTNLFIRESKPLDIGSVFDNHTLLGRIFKTDQQLFQIVKAAIDHEKELQKAARAKEQAELHEAAARAERDLDALRQVRSGITVLPDGRRITMGGGKRIR